MYNQYGIRQGDNQQIEQSPNSMAFQTTNVNSTCNQMDTTIQKTVNSI
jgi:hypothetical protein